VFRIPIVRARGSTIREHGVMLAFSSSVSK
jgi:hypothetical protein